MSTSRYRFLQWTAVLVAGASAGFGQSIISTILGAAPDGIPALSATLNFPKAVVGDSNGNVYASLQGTRQVVRIDTGGTVWLVAGNGAQGSAGDGGPAKSATLNFPVSLAIDSFGNLYICDSLAHRIRRVTPDGLISTFAGTGKAGNSGDGGPAASANLNAPSGIAFDGNGDLLIADTGNHEVRMVTPDGTITRIAGDGTRGSTGNDGPALIAELDSPGAVAVDSAQNIYVADTGNNWIRQIAPDGTMTRFAGRDTSTGSPFGGGDPNVATNATLTSPSGVGVDQAGNVYIMEPSAARVRRVTTDGRIANYAGTGTTGSTGDGGVAKSANINVLGISIDRHNNLLIADGSSNRVRIVTAADGVIDTIAGNGLASYNPRGLAIRNDVLYFSDGSSNRVRTFNLTTKQIGVVAGNGAASFAGDDGDALAAALNVPRGLAFDSSGRLYIADSANHRVRRVGTDGKITTVAGNGTATSTSNPTTDLSPATSTTLNEPDGVAVDSSGNLYIAERLGQRIRVVNTSGTINTVAGTGSGGAPDAETGIAVNQRVNGPQGVAVESGGTLLIVDSGNNRIRRLFPDGTIVTVAGGASGFGGDGDVATSAKMRAPVAAGIDAAGNIFIADTGNSVIRRVSPDGVIATVAGVGNASGAVSSGYNGDGSPATSYLLSGPSAIAARSDCSLMIADTTNQRVRQLWPAIDYALTTSPSNLQVTVDGQPVTTPATVGLLPGTTHHIDAPSPQSGPAGTRYLKISQAQDISVTCGAGRVAASLAFQTQYALTVTASDGGSVSPAGSWQDSGAKAVLTATPSAGFVFAGWEGSCSGLGTCNLTMDGPKTVKADFAPAQTLQPVIASGSVVGAGLSVPLVTTLSPNGIASIFGSNFAVSGTTKTVAAADLVNGQVPTKLAGVCVMVGGTAAPVFVVTSSQINFQVPAVPASGPVQVQVVTGCGASNEARSNAESLSLQSAAPEFFYFTQNSNGKNPIAAVNASTGALVGPTGLIPGAAFVPAKPGDVLTMYATGFGATSPSFAAGQLPDQAAQVTGAVQVSLGASALPSTGILYTGVTPNNAGLYQLNIRVPDTTADGDQPVSISMVASHRRRADM